MIVRRRSVPSTAHPLTASRLVDISDISRRIHQSINPSLLLTLEHPRVRHDSNAETLLVAAGCFDIHRGAECLSKTNQASCHMLLKTCLLEQELCAPSVPLHVSTRFRADKSTYACPPYPMEHPQASRYIHLLSRQFASDQ